MRIILSNNTEMIPIAIIGGKRVVQGANRDVLTFVFPATMGMAAIDDAFIAENCENITIIADDGSEYIHKAYTVRASLEKAAVEVTPATEDLAAAYEERITVSMGQRTYAETQMAEMKEALELLLSGDTGEEG